MLALVPAVVLTTLRYSETSKIVRLATREHGVVSAIAKGALRPRSRFGAALQPFSEGQAHLLLKPGRELQLLTAFDVGRVHAALADDVARYAAASTLAELMVRFAPAEGNPDAFELLRDGLAVLEAAPPIAVDLVALRILWRMLAVLGFAPALDRCAVDGAAVPPGDAPFSARDGGLLCAACATSRHTVRLPADARAALDALLDAAAPLPLLDEKHLAAHRRLAGRYVQHHLAEGAELPALAFWLRQSWVLA